MPESNQVTDWQEPIEVRPYKDSDVDSEYFSDLVDRLLDQRNQYL